MLRKTNFFKHRGKPASQTLAYAVAIALGVMSGTADSTVIDNSQEYFLLSELGDSGEHEFVGGTLKSDQSGTNNHSFIFGDGFDNTINVNGQNVVFTGYWGGYSDASLNIEGEGTITFKYDSSPSPGGSYYSVKTVFAGEKLVLEHPYLNAQFEIRSGEADLRGSGANTAIRLGENAVMNVYPDTFGAGWNTDESGTEPLVHTKVSSRLWSLLAENSNLRFYIPSWWEEGMIMLQVARTADISNTKISVGIDGDSSGLQVGDVVTLIRALAQAPSFVTFDAPPGAPAEDTLIGTPANEIATAEGMQGVTLEYEFLLSNTGSDLLAKVTRINVSGPAEEIITGSHLSGVALLTLGSDLISNRGIALALDAARMSPGLQAFGAINGGKSKFDKRLSLDVKGYNALTGLAYGHVTEEKHFITVGGFFEYGSASYDLSANHAESDGDTDNVGAGVLARVDFAENEYGYFYTEGSFRGGSARTRFTGELGCDGTGIDALLNCGVARYKSATPYIGASLGAGYILNFANRVTLNTYTKFLWTHQNSDKAQLTSGETLRFDSINSNRLKVGARLSLVSGASDRYSIYGGLSAEHEFDARVEATTNGYALKTPRLKGTAGSGEIGFTLRPIETSPFSINVSLEGYIGNRRGYTGGARAYYAF